MGPMLMLWTASSTGTSVPWMWALLRLPRFRGASHADDDDNRFRYRQVVLPEAVAMSCRYRSLRLGAPLVARAPGTGSHRAVDAAGLCEALRQAAEE